MIDRLTHLFILIKRFEGCHLMPYWCPAGVLTCGWGSTGPDVILGVPWSQEKADARLQEDAMKFTVATLAACPGLVIEADAKLCAIADFAYNLGTGKLRASTLRKRINSRDWTRAQKELMKWIYGGGRVLRGLAIRRAAESQLLAR